MGKAYQGMFGNWAGRTGNVVARISQGRTITGIYRRDIRNPQTLAQRAQRARFTMLAQLAARFKPLIKETYKDLDGYNYGTPQSAFVGFNFKQDPSVFTGDYPNQAIDFTKIKPTPFSSDGLMPEGIASEASEGAVGVTWSEGISVGQLSTDQVWLAVYNPTKKRLLATTTGVTRADRRITRSYPSSWEGDTLYAWLIVKQVTPEATLFSAPYYLGDFES